MKPSYALPLQNRVDLLREAAEKAERRLRKARQREHELKREVETCEMRMLDARKAYAGKVSATQPGVTGSATEEDVREAEAAFGEAREELSAIVTAIGAPPVGEPAAWIPLASTRSRYLSVPFSIAARSS